jgi:N-methylhydantoinase A
VRAVQLDVRAVDPGELDRIFDELGCELPVSLDEVELVRTAELRYDGQTWEIEIGVDDPADTSALVEAFEAEHERLYGVRGEHGAPIDIRALRLAALGPVHAVSRLSLQDGFEPAAVVRETLLGDLPVRSRGSIGEAPVEGPMLIDEYDTTVVVRPGWSARRDPVTDTLVLESLS